MPEPINSTPALRYSYPEEPQDADLTCRAPAPNPSSNPDPAAGAGGTLGVAPNPAAARQSNDGPPSCLAPALKTVASCAGILLTEGVAALLAGSTCVASAIELDNCLAANRAKKE